MTAPLQEAALLAEPRPALAAVQAIYSRAALPDPYPLYQQARQYGEVVSVPEWNAAAIFGHAEASAALRSPAALSGAPLGGDEGLSALPEAVKLLAPMMLFHNGPSHARLRGLVSAAFTPKVVAEQEELVRQIVQRQLAAVPAGPFDLVDQLAIPLPVAVITGMLGLSSADEGQFRLWTQSVAELLGGVDTSPELLARIESDAREMRSYFRDLADELRAHPQPGLLSALAAAEDEEGRLSSDELLANAGVAACRRTRNHQQPDRARRAGLAAAGGRVERAAGLAGHQQLGGRRTAALHQSGAVHGPHPGSAARNRWANLRSRAPGSS